MIDYSLQSLPSSTGRYSVGLPNNTKYSFGNNPGLKYPINNPSLKYLQRGGVYNSSTLIQALGKRNGYNPLERLSLPYLGSLESQTNKTHL